MKSLLEYGRRHHLGVIAVFFAISGSALAVSGTGSPGGVEWDGQIAGQRVEAVRPDVLRPDFSATPPRPSSEQIEAAERQMRLSNRAWARRTQASSDAVAGPVPGTETEVSRARAASDISFFRKSTLSPPALQSSSTNEPSVSQSGKNVWYTGNWYAARSASGGQGFTYVDPYADFPDFCCDQDTVYDPRRNLHLWYRQGVAGATQNVFKLGASTNGGSSWCTYTFSPTTVNAAWTSRWFDYPNIHLTNRSLYITTNLFFTGGGFDRMVLIRFPLDTLATCSPVSPTQWSSTTGWAWSGIEGASTTMYLGDQINAGAGTFRIYKVSDGSSAISFVDRTIPAWTFTNAGDATCTISGGTNPCGHSDQRILAGWRRQLDSGAGEVGFMWNVAQGGGFPKPYVEAASFSLPGLTYQTRPYIWGSGTAYQYPSAAPDSRGSLGINLTQFTSTTYPTQVVGLDDDYNGVPPGWEIYAANSSTSGPDGNRWGDYSRIRAFQPLGIGWVASNYTERAGSQNAQPRYVLFGRERDSAGIQRWWGS